MRPPSPLSGAIARELQASVKWTLAREEHAVKTIQKLSYRLECDSELAMKARSYAAQQSHYIERLRVLLPSDPTWADETFTVDNFSDAVIKSLDLERATWVLIRFLSQHAETTSDALMFAGDRLNSQAIYRLWRKAERERAKLATWLDKQEKLRIDRLARAEVRGASGSPPAPDASEREPGAKTSTCGGAIKPAAVTTFPHREGSRLSYNPPQIVRWM